ncbi:MAG: B12-binding domain-containing radical SAM protein [Candidatus Omnitrophica bacterium]|nr:B12-binding domain-containing radical SAM protein [Candidatus Omnitrophota bacterium]
MDFILVNLPPWAQDNPHIGIGYLSAYLRIKDISFKVLDLNKSFFLNQPDFRMLWHVENKNFWSNENTFPLLLKVFEKDIKQAVDDIAVSGCDVLGFSVVDPKEKLTIEFIKRIKEKSPGKKIILGGPATSTPEQREVFLENVGKDIDVFVIGEGEEILFNLLDRFLQRKGAGDVESCYARINGKWVCTPRKILPSLEKLPFPTYEEFDLGLYGKSLLVEWSRGCKGKCAFCKNYRLFSEYRSKSATSIMDELKYHRERYGIEDFTVTDSILNGDLPRLKEVSSRIIKEGLKIQWTGQIAPNRNMDLDFFKMMKNAGCFKLQIGLESGSNKVLKAMRKTFTAEDSEKNIRFASKAGIETEIFIMIGFPSETEKDFQKTYDFIKSNVSYIDTLKSINTLHLIAGTEVFEERVRFGIKPLNHKGWHYLWETYDGNVYELRKKRAQRLIDLASILGIRVMETNIQEGKETIFETIKDKSRQDERIALLKDFVNRLQQLPQKNKVIKKKKRGLVKWLILISLSIYTFLYIIYFWAYMILRNKVLLGGRKR